MEQYSHHEQLNDPLQLLQVIATTVAGIKNVIAPINMPKPKEDEFKRQCKKQQLDAAPQTGVATAIRVIVGSTAYGSCV